ncbi:hypothetical protein CEP54_016215 [Fusarium duplospermum]|uniref:Uncharacterized protein n=1 Tax=Fusarium duplospermum TaxID=1325734 RepID=A0A428NGY7_9HYPO|nr:hypothetical protein CEP54_016215 [Fusarium duplospermum]
MSGFETTRKGLRLPSAKELGTFDGSSAASRWLARLNWGIQAANVPTPNPDPKVVLRAIVVFAEGPAAAFLESPARLQPILEDVYDDENTQVVTLAELRTVTQALKDRFPHRDGH